MAVLDHLVVAATDLDSGRVWLEQRLGVALAPGGHHAAMGTHNQLLRLGDRLYLELIAIDPAAERPSRPRWFGLDTQAIQQRLATGPQLIHWVARSDALAQDAGVPGLPPTDLVSMARGSFHWRISVPPDGSLPGGHGLLPTLIQWAGSDHPADRLPDRGCELMKLEAFCAGPASIRHCLAQLGLEKVIDIRQTEPGTQGELIAYLKTPVGLVELSGVFT